MAFTFVLLYADNRKQEVNLTCETIEEAQQQCIDLLEYYQQSWECVLLHPIQNKNISN